MSQDTQTTTKMLKLSDTSIAMIRDLLQLSLLLGVNIIDNLRAMRFDVNQETGSLLPNEEYVKAYNNMIMELEKQVAAVMEAQQQASASNAVADAEVVESQPTDSEKPN